MAENDGRKSRRLGGRRARQALREAGPEANPAEPGQSGGSYRPLTDAEISRLHAAALDVLDNIGMGEVPQIVQEAALARGCRLNDMAASVFRRPSSRT